ncbi:MAG: hypothetical protein Fur0011_6670 [Candidatus Microgenomates bacterium]
MFTMTWENICVFGDSITWGAHRLPSRLSWTNLLRNELENEGREYRVYDLGIDMNTTKDLIRRFAAEASARDPHIIIINIGVNDSLYRKTIDYPETDLRTFKENMTAIIAMARTFTDKVMLVGLVKGDDKLTMPLAQSTTGKIYTKSRVREYDRIIKDLAETSDVVFADVNDKLDDSDFSDGLHPNEIGYKKMYKEIRQAFDVLVNKIRS